MELLVKQIMWAKEMFKMSEFYLTILIFFLFKNNLIASVKNNILERNLKTIENISFNFYSNKNGKDEKEICTIKYPKKIFCEYIKEIKNISVKWYKTLVIKNNKQYYRYPLKKTALNSF